MAFIFQTFKTRIKDANWHFEWFKNSRLHDLIDTVQLNPTGAFPNPHLKAIADAYEALSAEVKRKYAVGLDYLERNYPGLKGQLVKDKVITTASVGPSVPGYTPGKWERTKDADNRWHDYVLQQRGNSCGPSCVLMLKKAYYPESKGRVSEQEIRGLIAQFESGLTNQGISTVDDPAQNLHDWANVGSTPSPLVKALKSTPLPLRGTEMVYCPDAEFLGYLRERSPKEPAIVGWWWGAAPDTSLGGHWTVCIGPTSDNSRLVILDPWNGVQYLTNTEADFTTYDVVESGSVTASGWLNGNDASDVNLILPAK
jgi:hypothetical protein